MICLKASVMSRSGPPEPALRLAIEQFESVGVNVERALSTLQHVALSLPCWQGDDVSGFEETGTTLGGGIAVTGSYPGKARTADELRADLDVVLSLVPGSHRISLHAIYGEFDGVMVDRDEVHADHFRNWISWAQERKIGLDFNPTFFSHPLAADGFTLSAAQASTREFWIRHGIACRFIGAEFGRQLGTRCVTNVWIPDGMKDSPIDRRGPRERLVESLDRISHDRLDERHHADAVESKLFGIGSESYVVGSYDFYLGYAAARQKILCLDMGHFHPTECVADKLSATSLWVPELLLHVSRGLRWDSDHVVTRTDSVRAVAEELVRCDLLNRTCIGLDFFDASINRVAALVIGACSVQKSLLEALLQPTEKLRSTEQAGDYTSRLAWLEHAKLLPYGVIWDEFCRRNNVPAGIEWLDHLKKYESSVLATRSLTALSTPV